MRPAILVLCLAAMPHVARADKLYAHFNPLPWELGSLVEPELARRLRRRGYAVRQA